MAKTFSRDEVATHNKVDDVWLIIDTKVYDVTDFVEGHPGGEYALTSNAGRDVTDDFYGLHRHEVLTKYSDFMIGTIEGEKQETVELQPGDLSPVPYAEPLWLRPAFHSPYYTDAHRQFQRALRKFNTEQVRPVAIKHEESGEYPTQEFIDTVAKDEMLLLRLGPGPHLHGKTFLNGTLRGEDFSAFYELIMIQEGSRSQARGFQDGNLSGFTIGLPPVLHFGQEALKKQIIPSIISGKKKIALAISEAYAGSDALALRTTATKQADGSWVLNGIKKWITNGAFADYFSTAALTEDGLTMFLVERTEGLTTKQIRTSYSPTAGTAHVIMDNVKVPAGNVLGEVGMGGFILLSNFNHERLMMISSSVSASRLAVEETWKWSCQRSIFKKKLIDQPVIRQKFGKLFSLLESHQAWLESIVLQMSRMNYREQANHLAGPIALLKASTTRVAHEVADECMQIWGGRGLTKDGMGKYMENFARTHKFDAILGGSEEILFDLGVRQALRKMPKVRL